MSTPTEAPRAERQQLAHSLGQLDATMIVIGSMIGSGIFITSAESARLVGSPGWLLMAWALAGLLTITGALCCAELAAMMPKAGGQYVFLREAYSPLFGFLFGWAVFLVIQTGTIAAVAVAFARFTGVLVPVISGANYLIPPVHLGSHYAISLSTEQLVAVVMILLLTWTNTRGLELGKLVQNSFTFAKTAALIGLIVLGLVLGWGATSAARTASWWDSSANGWVPQVAQPGLAATGTLALLMLLGRAMVGPLFAQSAWNNVTFTAGEVRDPGRALPRALLIGCAVVVTLYVLANVAYIAALPLEEIQRAPQGRVAVAAMNAMLGPIGTTLMAIAIMISTFGCNNGLILAGARVYYAMARDGLFFRKVAKLNARKAPAMALLTQGIWASFLTLPRTITSDATTGAVTYGNVYTQLLEYIVSVDLVFYGLMVAAVIVLRRKMPDAPRPYRTWGYPIVPWIYIILAGLLILDIGYLAPSTSGIGYLLVLTGIPVYLMWRRRTAGTVPTNVLLLAFTLCLAPGICHADEPAKAFESGAASGIEQRWRGYIAEGAVMMSIRQYDRAIRYFTNALEQGPPAEVALDLYRSRGNAHMAKGEREKARADYARVLRAGAKNNPDFWTRAHVNVSTGNYKAAAADYAKAAELEPDDAQTLNDLAWLRATCPDLSHRNAREALRLATRACELSKWRNPEFVDTLAAAHAEAGNFDEAVKQQELAIRRTAKENLDGHEERLALYRQRKPYRDPDMGRAR